MRRRKYYRTNKRGRKRGRGVSYIYNNRIYLGKKTQKGTGAVSRVLAHLLQNVGYIIGL